MLSPYKGKQFRLTSRYAVRTLDGVTSMHKGIDLVGVDSKDIVAIAPGKVVRSRIVTNKNDATWQWGNYVAVQQDDGNVCYYCHLQSRAVKVGQRVNRGDIIGVEGNTGRVWSSYGGSGRHLHLEIRNSKGVSFNVADYIGIQNAIGTYTNTSTEKIDYASRVCEICGLAESTKQYLNQYKFAEDLWRKIYDKLKK